MLRSIIRNPELWRNIWLEFSPVRLILMPLVLTLVFIIVYVLSHNPPTDFNELMRNVNRVFSFLFMLIVYVWGTKQAADSVVSEVNDRTWDNQRLTPITPMGMTLGKLFGCALFQWYGGVVCLLYFFISNLYTFGDSDWSFLAMLWPIYILVLSGILIHSFTALISLNGIRKNRQKKKVTGTPYLVFSLILVLLLNASSLFRSNLWTNYGNNIKWYNLDIAQHDFHSFSLLLFTLWSLIGLFRAMRSEFQLYNRPWCWILFVVCMMLYFAGFQSFEFIRIKKFGIYGNFIAAACAGVIITYYMAFSEPKSIVNYRLIFSSIKTADFKTLFRSIPLWGYTLAVMILYSLLFIIVTPYLGAVEFNPAYYPLFPLSILFFVIRDISMLLYLNLTRNNRRMDLLMLLFLLIFYICFPTILTGLGWSSALAAVLPIPFSIDGMDRTGLYLGTLIAGAQGAFMFYLLYGKYRKKNAAWRMNQGN